MHTTRRLLLLCAAVTCAWPCSRAQQPTSPNTSGSDLLSSPTEPKPQPSSTASEQLLGNWAGVRAELVNRGVTLGLIYTSEEFGNPVGGVRQGQVFDGLVEADLDLDFAKLAHLPGLKLHASAFEIHGPSGTDKYVGDFGRFSNIDFYDSARLFEAWVEEEWPIGKRARLSLRAGQLSSDKEFYGSEMSALFINSSYGVLPTISANLPAPIYAIAAPGVRLRFEPNEALYVQAAVYDGNPDPDTIGDPSPGSRSGTTYNHAGIRVNLNSKEGAFALAEIGYRLHQGTGADGLPGTYKLGGFYHTDTFSDDRFDQNRRPLGAPGSTGVPQAHSGNYGGYLIVDQALYRPEEAPAAVDQKGGKDSASPPATGVLPGEGLAAFLRVSAAPEDRNTISFYLDGGLEYRGLVPTRDKDLLGLAVSYARFSDSLAPFDVNPNFFAGNPASPYRGEVVVECTYQAVLTPWCAVQPDVQAIVHPGNSHGIDDALVLGLRTVLTF